MTDRDDAAWAEGFVKRADGIGIIPEAVPALMRLAVQLDGHKQAQAAEDPLAAYVPPKLKAFGSKALNFLNKFFGPDPDAVAMRRDRDARDAAWIAANRPKPAAKPNVYVSPV